MPNPLHQYLLECEKAWLTEKLKELGTKEAVAKHVGCTYSAMKARFARHGMVGASKWKPATVIQLVERDGMRGRKK